VVKRRYASTIVAPCGTAIWVNRRPTPGRTVAPSVIMSRSELVSVMPVLGRCSASSLEAAIRTSTISGLSTVTVTAGDADPTFPTASVATAVRPCGPFGTPTVVHGTDHPPAAFASVPIAVEPSR
jgi:hypothetical protein